MRNVLLVLALIGLSCSALWAQGSLRGQVTDAASGDPIEGATVLVTGTTRGALTDGDGRYSLSLPEGAKTLTVSFIGYSSQKLPIEGQSVLDVGLKPADLQLEEVVVTAFGISREKKSLGYGVENIDGDAIAQRGEPDPLRAMQGKIAGVNITSSSSQPGSSTRFTIRGNSSLLGDNQPLFVVDGIPYNNNNNLPQASFNQLVGSGATSSRIADIDPNNIKSVTILKGAAAAALYGTRAANGVVIIETKSGNAEFGDGKLQVRLNSAVSFERIVSLPDYQNTYGTGVNFDYDQVNGSWGAPFVGTRPYASVTEIPHWYRNEPSFPDLPATVPYRAYPNNVSDFFDTGVIFDNSVSFTAGNENAAVSAVVSYIDQKGFVPNTSYQKLNLNLGGKARSTDQKFSLDWNLQFTNADQLGSTGGANNAVGNSSQFARTMFLGRNWDLHGQPFARPSDSASVFFVARTSATNPRWSSLYEGVTSQLNRLVANTRFSYEFTPWLEATYLFGYNTYSDRFKEWFNPGSRAANSVGQVTTSDVLFTEIESNLFLTFQKDLDENFYLKATGGYNVNQRTTDRQAVQGQSYVNFNINDLDNTSNVVPFGGIYQQQRIMGFYADVMASYRNYLFLNVKGRNDIASTLGANTRSFFYPAVSASFSFLEAFNLESQALNFGNLRASWAQVGNAPGPYLTQSVFLANPTLESTSTSFPDFPFQVANQPLVPGAGLEDIAYDPNLRSELTTEVEFGLEMRLFDNRVGFDVAVYDRRSTDQLALISTPASSGFEFFYTNIGEVSNRGIELTLDLTPVKVGDFRWDLTGTYTQNKNVIENLENLDEVTLRNTFSGSVSAVHIAGQEYGLIRGTVNARDDEGNLLIDPSNGQLIRAIDQQIVGNPNPDFVAGLVNTFTWKGFTLSGVLDYRQGGDLYSVTVQSMLGRGVTTDTEDREFGAIIPGVYGDPNTGEPIRDGEGNKIPNATMIETNTAWFGETFGINSADEWNVFDATVIRLREASLSYNFPASWMERTPFASISLAVVGRNLWFLAPNFPEGTNFDPETNTFGNTNAQGFEFTTAPSVRRLGFNLSASF